uniref:Spt20-like SEP domain-containing protein n=1 Tax=Chinchilla lanigera TaxID=34839 RepID=A0A8C2YIM3_CHILA
MQCAGATRESRKVFSDPRFVRTFPLTGPGCLTMPGRYALEQALDRAEEVISEAQQRPPARRVPLVDEKSLHDKLYGIYVEEFGKEPEATEELTTSVKLLEKLVSRESLPCLVFSLYPGDQGYSVVLDDKSASFSETIALPYEQGKLLEYLDAQQLPPVLLDVLGTSQVNLFHSGCIVAEIRDYRQCEGPGSPAYRSRHVLLRASMQTLVCDVEAVARENPGWSQQDKLSLESQLILATSEPVCLDSSVAIAHTANRLLFNMQKMNTAPMQQCFKRPASPCLSLQEQSSLHASHPASRVLTACKKRKERKLNPEYNLKITEENYVDSWKQRPCNLTVPSEIDVHKYAKGNQSVQPGNELLTFCSPLVPEDDLVLDPEAGSQLWETNPSVLMSNNDPLWCDMIDPPKFPILKRHKHPTHTSTGDHSGGLTAGSKTDAVKAVSTCQNSVQSEGNCAGKMVQGSSTSTNMGPPSSKAKTEAKTETKWTVTSVAKESSVSKTAVKQRAPTITITSSSGPSSSVPDPSAGPVNSSQKSPPPAPQPGSLSQKFPVSLKGVNTVPPVQPHASHSQGALVTQNPARSTSLKVIHVTGPGQRAQILVSGSNSTVCISTGAPAAKGTQPSGLLPLKIEQPSAGSGGKQPSSQPGLQIILHNRAGLLPLTIIQVPPGPVILRTQPQAQPQQPQHLPQPPSQTHVHQLTPQPQLQKATTILLTQRSPQVSVQGLSSQQRALPAQQDLVINHAGERHFVKPQATVLGQHGSGQQRPGQSFSLQKVQVPPATQQQLGVHGQVQSHQVKHQQCPASVATVATETTCTPQRGHTACPPKGSTNRGPPATPKP